MGGGVRGSCHVLVYPMSVIGIGEKVDGQWAPLSAPLVAGAVIGGGQRLLLLRGRRLLPLQDLPLDALPQLDPERICGPGMGCECWSVFNLWGCCGHGFPSTPPHPLCPKHCLCLCRTGKKNLKKRMCCCWTQPTQPSMPTARIPNIQHTWDA